MGGYWGWVVEMCLETLQGLGRTKESESCFTRLKYPLQSFPLRITLSFLYAPRKHLSVLVLTTPPRQSFPTMKQAATSQGCFKD